MPARAVRPALDPRFLPVEASTLTKPQIYLISRLVICAIIVGSLGPLFWTPPNEFWYVVDVLFRSWVTFLGTVMGHEGSHGHLGRTKAANFWWGRIAFIPTMVPFTNFSKTHNLHHLHTNEPDRDPDHFMNARHAWELPLRAVAMPHQWFFWLRKRGRIKRRDVIELALNYVGLLAIFGIILAVVGPRRLLTGVLPVFLIVSLLLWYPFAFKTHEGFSTGSEESRSHSYYGRFLFWFSLGLSLHREHHLRPDLSWIELYPSVRPTPEKSWRRFLPRRDVQVDAAGALAPEKR
jgi:beta-carotene hydroxylase